MIFLTRAELVGETNAGLKKEISNFEKYLKPNSLTYKHWFSGLLLFSLISETEIYFVDTMKVLIKRYPKKIGSTEFKLSEILDLSQDEVLSIAAEDYLNRLMYRKASEYLTELSNILAVDKAPLEQHWAIFVEAKARRDLGAHNNWRINKTYIRKIGEVGTSVPTDQTPTLVPDENYISTAIKNCDSLVTKIHEQLMVKYA